MRLIPRAILIMTLVVACKNANFFSIWKKGNPPPEPKSSTEVIAPTFLKAGLLDILLVIDNSDSMSEEQVKLSSKLSALLTSVSNSDWQLAIATTDPRDCLKAKISKETPDYESVFTRAVTGLGTSGTTYEQPIRMAVTALQRDCEDRSWLRKDSTVVVIIVTDEDHLNDGFCGSVDERGLSHKPVDREQCELAALYLHLKKIRPSTQVYGIINTASAHRYINTKMPGGKPLFEHYASINAADYTDLLTNISKGIHAILQKFYLNREHNGKTSVVSMRTSDGKEEELHPNDYTISERMLIIKTDLPVNIEEITVTYSHD
ncbi:MAG: VWA domain-containing protein [Pseudomonadota bacterium]|nr:VWA domain-containing protein [Pseudomonadota bacterium]